MLAGDTFCTTSSDGNRRDNSPNTAGEASPGTAVVGKVSCLDQKVDSTGLPLPDPLRWSGADRGSLRAALDPLVGLAGAHDPVS